MAIEPTSILTTVHLTGRGDPAFDADAEGFALAVTEHARNRDADSLDALRGFTAGARKPVEFHLTPLSPAAMYNLGAVGAISQRCIDAFRASCFAVTDRDGVRHEAKLAGGAHGGKRQTGTYTQTPFEWFERWAAECGMDAIVEAGAVALARAEVSPEDVGFYWPLAGVRRLMR